MQNAKNSCKFIGRMAKDIDVQTIQGGANGSFKKGRFSIAVDRALSADERQKVKNGDTSIQTCDFIECEVTGDNLIDKLISPFMPKGKAVVVDCHYQQYTYNDKNSGEKRYGHKFIVDAIDFVTQDAKDLANNNGGNGNGGNNGYNNYGNNGYNNNNYGNNNYGNNNRQQQPPQNSGFAMFDDTDQPF